MSLVDDIAPYISQARPLQAGAPYALTLDLPDGYNLVALMHGFDVMEVAPDEAIAILIRSDFEGVWESAQRDHHWAPNYTYCTAVQTPAHEADGDFLVWKLPAATHPAIVYDYFAEEGGPLTLSRTDEPPPLYRELVVGERFDEIHYDRILYDVEGAEEADERGDLDAAAAFLMERAGSIREALDQSHQRNKDGGVGSHVGGLPKFHADWINLPEGSWRYVAHLAADLFDSIFGDAGSLHLWLDEEDERAILLPDSA